MSIFKIINLIERVLNAFDTAREKFGEWYRSVRARNTRNAVDGGDTNAISSRVRDILKKRRKRRDAS